MQTIVNVMVDKQLYKYVGHIQEIAYNFLKDINYYRVQWTTLFFWFEEIFT